MIGIESLTGSMMELALVATETIRGLEAAPTHNIGLREQNVATARHG